jgi:hypothetical protein
MTLLQIFIFMKQRTMNKGHLFILVRGVNTEYLSNQAESSRDNQHPRHRITTRPYYDNTKQVISDNLL